MNTQTQSRVMTVGLETKLWFGGYKGNTIRQMTTINPGYLNWAMKENIIILTSHATLELISQGLYANGKVVSKKGN